MFKKYLPYTLLIGLAIVLVLIGFASISSADPMVVEAGALPLRDAQTNGARSNAAFPARHATTPLYQNPSDPAVLVMSGELGNGGYWNWTDIANLLGVYNAYGAFEQVTVGGQQVQGVPLAYLLHYVQVNEYATTLVAVNRDGDQFTFPVASLTGCEDCLVALTAENTLALVLPGRNPEVIAPLMRLDAYSGDPAIMSEADIPEDSQTLVLTGRFGRAGNWTWEDISNLLGVYRDYGAFETVYIDEQAYVGVPVAYLLDYAQRDASAMTLVIYDRSGERYSVASATLAGGANYLIAPAPDGTLALVLPGLDPDVIEQIAGIEAR